MKKYLILIILVCVYSCKEDNSIINEKKRAKIGNEVNKENKGPNQDKVNNIAQKFGDLYNPQKMEIKGNRVGSNNEKENYKVTLTNSDLLDSDIANIEKHAKKIAIIYYSYLSKNVKPFNFKKIIIKIEHKNNKVNDFEYSEKDINSLLDLK